MKNKAFENTLACYPLYGDGQKISWDEILELIGYNWNPQGMKAG